MHSDLAEIGWTEDHWNRIVTAVTEEAQKARVAAQMLPMVTPEDSAALAVPDYSIATRADPGGFSAQRLRVDSDPTLFLTSIAVNVQVKLREAADPNLSAALGMFRRAANYIARIEDSLVFNGRPGADLDPPFGLAGIPNVSRVTGNGAPDGLLLATAPRMFVAVAGVPVPAGATLGDRVVVAIIESINQLEAAGQLGPFACVLSPDLFAAICTPGPALVMPRDRILPFLQGALVRSSAVLPYFGAVVALSASAVELVVASDIGVRFLQTTEEPRLVFRVSERVALRVRDNNAISILL